MNFRFRPEPDLQRELPIMRYALAIATISASLATFPLVAAEGAAQRQRVFWPKIVLANDAGERIDSIEITMSCGRFRGMSNIPNDWSVEVISPSSEVTTLKASAGHGATALWNMRELDGVIAVLIKEPACFDISAVVVATTSDNSRSIKFKKSDLHLRP